MKKILKCLSVIMIFVILTTTFSACSKEKDIVGQWYDKHGEVIDVREDGTYDDKGYGTGRWKFLDDKETIEFTDFYGYTNTTKIEKDELGYTIFNGRYYKDAYPSEEEISEYREKVAISLDAFEGLTYEVTGISPYCKITINNQGCSETVQNYVKYTLDKDYYANGEKAVITAVLSESSGEEVYKLKSSESSFSVSGQPEYISSTKDIDFTSLKEELADYITTIKSSAIGKNDLFDVSDMNFLDYEISLPDANFYSRNGIKTVDFTLENSYISTLKAIKLSAFDSETPYNKISFVYTLKVTADVNNEISKGNLYVNISANNIIKYPDGSIKWGLKNEDAFDFSYATSTEGIENCVTKSIMNKSDNYNISKVKV